MELELRRVLSHARGSSETRLRAFGGGWSFSGAPSTDGYLLRGVKYFPDGATTHSMVMRGRSGTIRYIEAEHRFEKLERFSRIAYRP